MEGKNSKAVLTAIQQYMKELKNKRAVHVYCGLDEDGAVTIFGDANNSEIVRAVYELCRTAKPRLGMCSCESCTQATDILQAFGITINSVFTEEKPERMN
jgi:hypothetical protein